jgi:hypothetical protein
MTDLNLYEVGAEPAIRDASHVSGTIKRLSCCLLGCLVTTTSMMIAESLHELRITAQWAEHRLFQRRLFELILAVVVTYPLVGTHSLSASHRPFVMMSYIVVLALLMATIAYST